MKDVMDGRAGKDKDDVWIRRERDGSDLPHCIEAEGGDGLSAGEAEDGGRERAEFGGHEAGGLDCELAVLQVNAATRLLTGGVSEFAGKRLRGGGRGCAIEHGGRRRRSAEARSRATQGSSGRRRINESDSWNFYTLVYVAMVMRVALAHSREG